MGCRLYIVMLWYRCMNVLVYDYCYIFLYCGMNIRKY